MRKIINFTHATVDGYIDNPQDWWLAYVDDELKKYELDMHLAADAVLLGRVTYQAMAQAWPNMGNRPFAGAFVDHVNSITHYVVTSTAIDTTKWDPTVVIPGDHLINEITRLKQANGGDILIWGTGQLTDTLAAAGLLDEYRISWAPIIKGGGQRLFRPASSGTLELLGTTGAVALFDRVARPTGVGTELVRSSRRVRRTLQRSEDGLLGRRRRVRSDRAEGSG